MILQISFPFVIILVKFLPVYLLKNSSQKDLFSFVVFFWGGGVHLIKYDSPF